MVMYPSRTVLTLFLFAIRAFATGYFQAVYLYTPEVISLMYMLSIKVAQWYIHISKFLMQFGDN